MTHSPHRTARRGTDDRGSTSLSVVLLTPVFIVLAFAAWQAALWTHARTEARAAARDAAALVARSDVDAGSAEASIEAVLASDTALRDIDVVISESNGTVIATVTGQAPGMVAGTSRTVSVTVAVPIEEITPP